MRISKVAAGLIAITGLVWLAGLLQPIFGLRPGPVVKAPGPSVQPISFVQPSPVEVQGVRLISSEPCPLWRAQCHTLAIFCEGLPERRALVREFQADDPKGAVVFAEGGTGTRSTIASSPFATETARTVIQEGFQVFDVIWLGTNGWATDVRQGGFKKAVCGYAKVVEWISANRAADHGVMCAQGNSGGSFQIGYGLAVYDLEELLDMAIVSGGPPVSRMDVACFGTEDPALKSAVWPEGTRRWAGPLTDGLMGWTDNGDYCRKGSGPEDTLQQLQDMSLVSPTEPRDYQYPRTKVNFINYKTDPQNANHQGRLYYEQIESGKSWYELPGVGHGVHARPEGAAKIRELFLNECRTQ